MGAEPFCFFMSGKTFRDAFNSAVEQACYDHGHAGYTGTIAEKSNFVEVTVPNDFMPGEKNQEKQAHAFANKLINDNDERIDDKWGPAGAIKVKKVGDEFLFLFFGWASS